MHKNNQQIKLESKILINDSKLFLLKIVVDYDSNSSN